tara:strand:+ start:1585 stop:2541 length:957 start_codon:yes stop_codon:yes gene_type:complete
MGWYRFYGWKENPFIPKSNPEMVGIPLTKKRILEYISNGDICFLNGPAGSGKTSLLKWAETNLKNHIPIYFSAEEIEDTDLEKKFKRSTWEKLMKKEFVLLLDESQESNETFQKAMKLNWDKNKIKSIVVAQIEPLKNFPDNFKHRIGNRIIRLNKLSKSSVVDMINYRTYGRNPLSAEAMAEIGRKSNYNPRKVLEYAERACVEMARKEKKVINLFDTKIALEDFKIEEGIKKPDELQPPEPPVPEMPKVEKKSKLSPLERKIVKRLKESDMTVKELAELLSSSEGSIGKQLSKLTMKSLVSITHEKRPKKYGIVEK